MRRLWLALLSAAFAVTLVSAAASAPQGGPVTITDPTGDNQTAPDVTALSVRQDGSRVIYEFTIAGRPANRLNDGEFIVFYIDADASTATGSSTSGGADFLIEFEQKGNGLLRIYRWNPTSKEFTFDVSFNSSFKTLWGDLNAPSDVFRAYFTPSMFSIGTKFTFFGRAESAGEGDNYDIDRAPDAGSNTFVLDDTKPPVAKALASRTTAGKVGKLSYQVSDESGSSREVVTVRKGTKILATVRTKLHPAVAGKTYSVAWKAPLTAKGALRFCVQPSDATGNTGAQSCAALTVG